MKIRTRVKIAGALTVCVLLAYGAVVLHLDRNMSHLAREVKEANEFVNKISILRNLTQDYLLYRTERAQRQWAALYDEVLRLLESPEYREFKTEHGLGDASQKLKTVGDTFSRLMTAQQTGGADHPEGQVRGELQSRLTTQLLLATQDLLTRFFNLTDEINQKLIRTQRLISFLDLLALLCLGLIILGAGVFLQRAVVKPVLKLHEGAEIIGGGNLDHRVAIQSPDEVGELTRAFDRMTANLRQMNLSLNLERRRFYDVLEMLPAYVVLLTPDYHVAFANRFFVERFGEDRGLRCFEYLFGRTEPCEICETYKVLKSDAPHRWEWTGPDGRNYDIFDYPFTDADGSPLIMEMGVDITERKRAGEALRLINRLLEIANRQTEIAPLMREFVAEIKELSGCEAVGIRLLDAAGNIPYHGYVGFSKEFYEMESPLSIHSDQCMCINVIKGTTDPSLPFYTPGGSFYMNATSRFLATVPEEDKGSTRNVCNATGYESVALVPIRLGEKIMGLIHLADKKADMVPLEKVELLERVGLQLSSALERVKAQEELRRFSKTLEQRVQDRTAALESALQDLERSNRDLEEFAFVSSHDLQEPLRKIANFSEMLGEQYRGRFDEQADRYLGYIADGAKRMQALINDLLAYSRAGRGELTMVPVSMEDVLKGTLNDLQPLLQETQARITHDPLPVLEVNPYQMGQLLQNLITNAIKFRGDQPPRIHISTRRDGGMWVFAVRDEGIGFDSQHADRIFKVFHRLHSKDKYQGTGIGLSICKKIAERHGGRCWAESQQGRGATFYFSIPV